MKNHVSVFVSVVSPVPIDEWCESCFPVTHSSIVFYTFPFPFPESSILTISAESLFQPNEPQFLFKHFVTFLAVLYKLYTTVNFANQE